MKGCTHSLYDYQFKNSQSFINLDLELKAFDFLMQKMPIEKADKRILIVGADEEDISNDKYGYPIPDTTLDQLLEKIQTYQPAAIGVDIFRDQPVSRSNNKNAQQQTLINQWKENKNLIAICAGSNLKNSVAPPPNIAKNQVGYVDLYDDKSQTQNQDDTIRRYLLSRSPNPIANASRCNTSYSFAWQLVYRYFKSNKSKDKSKAIKHSTHSLQYIQTDHIRISQKIF